MLFTAEKGQPFSGHPLFFDDRQPTTVAGLQFCIIEIRWSLGLPNFYLSLLVHLLCLGFLGQVDAEDTLIDVSLDFRAVYILGQKHCLLEFRVGKLATQVVAILLFLFVLTAVFECHHQVVLVVQVHREVLLGHTRSRHLNLILLLVLLDIDCRGYAGALIEPLGRQEVAKKRRHPSLIASYDCCHNFFWFVCWLININETDYGAPPRGQKPHPCSELCHTTILQFLCQQRQNKEARSAAHPEPLALWLNAENYFTR